MIVGASFAGLALAHHLPSHLKVLIIDAKPQAGSSVESTGLITERTRQEFKTFFYVDRFITNPITSICVIPPRFNEYFISTTGTGEPWIYQTDTKGLVKALADTLPPNVTFLPSAAFVGIEGGTPVHSANLLINGKPETISIKFLVGADGAVSKVASVVPGLDQNKKFLFGYEQVFFGDVTLGPHPAETIYHFWFGEFSLGYGGWLSPTIVNGCKAFRVGLAKLLKDRGEAKQLTEKFLQILRERKMITIEGEINQPGYVFGGVIPIGGALKRISRDNVLLIGNAAGFCGAFAADGIKGAIIAGKEAAKLIPRYLEGDRVSLREFVPLMNKHDHLMDYYKRQVRYRWIWDLMKCDHTFKAMWDIIAAEKQDFLNQFCDSKDQRKSLIWTVLKWRHLWKILKYSVFIVVDWLTV